MDKEELRRKLLDRVKENYADYRADLLLKDRQELIDGAGRIARTAEVFQYFTEGPLSETEVEYLLKFQNPLELVTDCWERELDWPDPNRDVLRAIIADIDDKRDFDLDYPLAKDAPVEKVSGLHREERNHAEKLSEVQQESKAEETIDREEYDVVELFGTTALFFNERLRKEDVPEGLYCYDLRGSDDDPGDPVSVEHHVGINHAGTILAAKPLEIPAQGYLPLGDELNFIGISMTVDEFRDFYLDVSHRLRTLGLEIVSYSHGKEKNAGFEISAKVQVGPVEYALGERSGKFPSFATWERTPANDGNGPPNYYWGHYFDNREKAVRDLCTRASEKYEMLMAYRKPSLREQLTAAKEALAEKPHTHQHHKDKGAR